MIEPYQTQDFPGINLDLYAYCNAKCTFCSYPHMTRKRGAMSDEIFHKVIDEVATLNTVFRIAPYFYGEPLMNPKFFEQCDYISEKLPDCPIELSTNGSLLSDEVITKLLRVKTLTFLNFSVYGGTKETYEKLIGLDFKTLDLIENCINRFRKERPDVVLFIGATPDLRFTIPGDTVELQRRFGNIVRIHNISFSSQHENDLYMRKIPNSQACVVPEAGIVVLWDGRVGLCCFDANGDLVVGDVNKTTFVEAVNGDLAKKFRGVLKQGFKDVIPLCRTCTQPI